MEGGIIQLEKEQKRLIFLCDSCIQFGACYVLDSYIFLNCRCSMSHITLSLEQGQHNIEGYGKDGGESQTIFRIKREKGGDLVPEKHLRMAEEVESEGSRNEERKESRRKREKRREKDKRRKAKQRKKTENDQEICLNKRVQTHRSQAKNVFQHRSGQQLSVSSRPGKVSLRFTEKGII